MRFLVLILLVNILCAESDDGNILKQVDGCAEDENLVLPFNYMAYNQLDHFEEIEQENRGKGEEKENLIEPMLAIFKKNEMEKYIGVNVLHNHVTIDQDEIMLEVPVQNTEDTSLVSVMGPMKKEQIKNVKKVPYLLKLDVETKKWIPLEFIVTNEIITESYTKFITNKEFQVELIDLIIELGVSDKFGITLKRRTQENTVEESGFNDRMHYIFELLPGTEGTTQYQVGYWSDSKLGGDKCSNHCNKACHVIYSHHKTAGETGGNCRRYWSHHKTAGTNITDYIDAKKILPEEEYGFLEVMDKRLGDFLHAYLSLSS